MLFYYQYVFSIGTLYICADESSITHIGTGALPKDLKAVEKETELIKLAASQLTEYLAKKRTGFEIPIKFKGTAFQEAVWKALMAIDYGKVKSYKEIAVEVNSPKGFRAVGNACNKNPLLIIVPCHRVVGTNKSLTGFACGLDVKQALLDTEEIKL
jgi:methylated-DNA-[protein]-cysteine S-methyltransferase